MKSKHPANAASRRHCMSPTQRKRYRKACAQLKAVYENGSGLAISYAAGSIGFIHTIMNHTQQNAFRAKRARKP